MRTNPLKLLSPPPRDLPYEEDKAVTDFRAAFPILMLHSQRTVRADARASMLEVVTVLQKQLQEPVTNVK